MQPFKCGPDYIDPKYHRLACGTETVNLDAFMMSREHIARLYDRYGSEADVSIVEGVMGFFDGYDRMTGSSALLAENLRIPVLLLIHAGSTAYSVAPILYGFKHFRPGVAPVGIVFNKVGSASHYRYLEEAAADAGVASLGYLPKMKDLEVPSRHLGLSVEVLVRYDYLPDRVADAIEKYVDVERLLGLMASDVDPVIEEESFTESSLRGRKCIAMADDEAFNFTYRENIRRLESRGRVVRFSPLRDNRLPADCDFLYLPGGYPEFYLPALSANASMKQWVRDYIESGGYALAECGGMMYFVIRYGAWTDGTIPCVAYCLRRLRWKECACTSATGEWYTRGKSYEDMNSTTLRLSALRRPWHSSTMCEAKPWRLRYTDTRISWPDIRISTGVSMTICGRGSTDGSETM